MNRISQSAACLALLLPAALAQPSIGTGGILNSASYALDGLPNAGIAPGSIFLIYGSNLGPSTGVAFGGFPLPTALAGTSVKVTAAGTTADGFVIYSSATFLKVILPSSTPVGSGTATVTYNGQTSAPQPVKVVKSAFGIYTINSAGLGPASVQNYDPSQNIPPTNTLTTPARPGQLETIWGTGLGAAPGNEAAGPLPGNLNAGAQVYVGGKLASVSYQGRSGCCAGGDQINFTVPDGVTGCYVPLAVRTGDVVSNFGTIAISNDGGPCSDPGGLGAGDLNIAQQSGSLRGGTIILSRTQTKLNLSGVGSIDSNIESGSATFAKYDLPSLIRSYSPFSNSATFGACTVFSIKVSGPNSAFADPIIPIFLDAGPVINIKGPNGTKQLKQTASGYSAQLGGGVSVPGVPTTTAPPFLDPGSYTIDNGSGGTGPNAVGAFSFTFNFPPVLTWMNIDSVNTIAESQGQDITWTGGDPKGTVQIVGVSATATAEVGFVCAEKTAAGHFTIPPLVLLNLPTASNTSFLGVNGGADNFKFTAPGLDTGSVLTLSGTLKTVTFAAH